MTGIEGLYYALGELAYAVAKADGTINKEERQQLHEIVVHETKKNNFDIDVSEIIFHILSKEDVFDSKTAFKFAIKEMKLYSNYLSPEMRKEFPIILEKVAKAFHPITYAENEILRKFEEELKQL